MLSKPIYWKSSLGRCLNRWLTSELKLFGFKKVRFAFGIFENRGKRDKLPENSVSRLNSSSSVSIFLFLFLLVKFLFLSALSVLEMITRFSPVMDKEFFFLLEDNLWFFSGICEIANPG